MPTVKSNLEHRHAFVRRNAVLTTFTIYRAFEHLMPDAPDLIENLLLSESDVSCKRNAFLMLFHCAQDRAVAFLADHLDQVANFGDIFQLVLLELIRKVCRQDPYQKSKYIRCILTLFTTSHTAVLYACATTLVALTTSPTAIRAAAQSYTQLLTSESDNNVKLILLERIQELKSKHSKVLQEMVMEILRALNRYDGGAWPPGRVGGVVPARARIEASSCLLPSAGGGHTSPHKTHAASGVAPSPSRGDWR